MTILARFTLLAFGIVGAACSGTERGDDESNNGSDESGEGGTAPVGMGADGGTNGGGTGGDGTVASGGTTMTDEPLLPESASPGCGVASTPGYTNETLMVGDVWRAYAVNVPAGYTGDRALPLVLTYHGRGVTADETRDYFGRHIESVVGEDAIVVYPEARADRSRSWNASDDGEYDFFDDLVSLLQETYCIDTARQFATGFSLGAQMVNGLRCKRGDVLLGVAPVAGGEGFNSAFAAGGGIAVECTGPVAAWIAHAPNDVLTDFVLGEETRDVMVATNGCSTTTTELSTSIACTTHVAYEGCGEHPVHWCEHMADHHYDALHAGYVWDFFSAL